jgi:hypothetical protein
MAAVVNTYKVHCHRETNGRKSSTDSIEYVQATAGDFETLKAVLVANGKVPGSGSIQISSAQMVSPTASVA